MRWHRGSTPWSRRPGSRDWRRRRGTTLAARQVHPRLERRRCVFRRPSTEPSRVHSSRRIPTRCSQSPVQRAGLAERGRVDVGPRSSVARWYLRPLFRSARRAASTPPASRRGPRLGTSPEAPDAGESRDRRALITQPSIDGPGGVGHGSEFVSGVPSEAPFHRWRRRAHTTRRCPERRGVRIEREPEHASVVVTVHLRPQVGVHRRRRVAQAVEDLDLSALLDTKTRPSGAIRIAVGSVNPLRTTLS